MRGLVIVCALGACNQAYDLEHTDLAVDAIQHGCPGIGADPTYSRYLTQAIVADCSAFELSPSRGRALGACLGPTARYQFVEVLADGTLAPARELPQAYTTPTTTVAYFGMRLLDDQRAALIEITASPGGGATQRIVVYRRGEDAAWREEEVLPFGTVVGQLISTFAADERVFLSKPPVAEEWARRAGTWQKVQTIGEAEIGTQIAGGMSISADGLRLLFYTSTAIAMYTDRPSVDAPFRKASGPIGTLPAVYAAMTGDCERVYFSGLQSIFYAERI
jgi:hypothetical protein